jgi:hypothetical protein
MAFAGDAKDVPRHANKKNVIIIPLVYEKR